MAGLPQLRVVLHQIRSPDNLGAVARLMANFGVPQLWVSDPVTESFHEARRLAVRAEHLLDGMRVVPGLNDALAQTVYALGSSARTDLHRRQSLSPEEGARRLIAHAAHGPVALVLGGEQRGLSDVELASCSDVTSIPTDPAVQPSMNLSQAAGLLLYLCAREDRSTVQEVAAEPGAPHALRAALQECMRTVLLEAGFLNPQQPDLVLGELTRTLFEGARSRREIELWVAAFKQLTRWGTRCRD